MPKAPPVLARVYRGPRVESSHRGSVAVVDERGVLLAGCGDPRTPVYVAVGRQAVSSDPAARGRGREEVPADRRGARAHVRLARRRAAARAHGRANAPQGRLPRLGSRVRRPRPDARAVGPRSRPPRRRADGPSQQLFGQARRHAARLSFARAARASGYVDPGACAAATDPDDPRALRGHPGIGDHGGGRRLQPPGVPAAALGPGLRLRAPGRIPREPGESPAAAVGEGAARPSDVQRAPSWSPGRAASRPTSSRPGADGGSARRAPRGSMRWASRRRRGAKQAVGVAFKIEDGSARPRDAVTLEVLSRLGRLPEAARRTLAAYAEPVRPQRPRGERRPDRGRGADRADRAGAPEIEGDRGAWPIATSRPSSRSSERDGDLVRVRERISPRLEISEIADRSGEGGRAGAALRERRGLGVSRRDQSLRHAPEDAQGARPRLLGGMGRASRVLSRSAAARGDSSRS